MILKIRAALLDCLPQELFLLLGDSFALIIVNHCSENGMSRFCLGSNKCAHWLLAGSRLGNRCPMNLQGMEMAPHVAKLKLLQALDTHGMTTARLATLRQSGSKFMSCQ